MDVAAVILAGGTAARLGGADKAAIEHAGRTFLEHALSAVAGTGEVVVVGEQVPTVRPVTFVREDPPLGGPVAGLLAGRHACAHAADLLVVLAVDMPRVTRGTIDRLLDAATGRDGAVLVDEEGRRQLVLVLRTDRLDAVAPDEAHGHSVRALLAPLDLAEVPSVDDEARGVDRWEDLRELGR
ncbi:MAG: molybdenum cofactor guanylyltransferase [Nocardioides sp.]